MFKKVIIADTFAKWATPGFDGALSLGLVEAWVTSLSYTFQLYFDFSGYTDMAIGAALLFNIRLPINFNSPYKALNIQDFWQRWHITLSRFLRDYVYIPLGGNRQGSVKTYVNLMATFLLGGLWHGASWMFVAWGAMHNFINLTWVFFRASDLESALVVIKGMLGLTGIHQSLGQIQTNDLAWLGFMADAVTKIMPLELATQLASVSACLIAFLLIAQKNTSSMYLSKDKLAYAHVLPVSVLAAIAFMSTLASKSHVFLYFNF